MSSSSEEISMIAVPPGDRAIELKSASETAERTLGADVSRSEHSRDGPAPQVDPGTKSTQRSSQSGSATARRPLALDRATTANHTSTLHRTRSSRTLQRESVVANSSIFSPFFEKLISIFDFFFPQSCSRLEIPAAFLKNCVRHRSPKNYYPLDNQSTFRAFRILSSETFRKVCIACALILAFLPTIEVPVSVPSPCWLSFLLELICYSILSARVIVEATCYSAPLRTNPWSALLKFALLLSWVDVVTCMSLVASNGGDFLSFNNCGMPEPDSQPRSRSWVYIVTRVSRYVRPIYFMEWNYRTRYLFRNMVKITGKLINILSILFVVIFLFASFAYFVWSDPNRYISTIGYRFDYFRSWFSAFVTMTTLTTTENYPDCMIDYMSVSFVNFFFFLIFVLLSVFFALNVVLSTVYDTYEENLQTYYFERLERDQVTVARAFQYLCDADKRMTRERFCDFMRVYEGMNHLDTSPSASEQTKRQLLELRIKADFIYSMCCIRRRFLRKGVNPLLDAFNNEEISEPELMQKLIPMTTAPISYSDFFELVSLIRYHLVIKRGRASSGFKNHTLKQISLSDIMRHVTNMNSREFLEHNPISLHSSSYFISGSSPTQLVESVLGESSVLNTADLFSGARPQRLLKETPTQEKIRLVHEYWLSRWICNLLIVLQFVLCLAQTISSNAFTHCKRYESEKAVQRDPWMFCESLKWYTLDSAADVETSFNAGHLSMSFVLLVDVFVVIYLQRRRFFFTVHEHIDWLNVADAIVQLSIFFYDLIDIPLIKSMAAGQAGSRPDFIAFGILRLLRVHKVLALATTVRDTIKLFRHLYPVIKAFFMIVYMFFFIWGILGMSLFSHAATENGIALYPNKSQFISFYQDRSESDYPNGNNPGNFGCNETDILGAPGFCGEYGPGSAQPYWDITPDDAEERAALDAAFVIGSSFDARVGGCFNLLGEANNRVLPCYCYYNAEKMNRTTSCDWINTKWYNTQLGQVSARASSPALPTSQLNRLQSNYWILNFNDFKTALVHLFGIMIVNNWNTFYFSYQTVFGLISSALALLLRCGCVLTSAAADGFFCTF
jgi:hypothetical protein